MSNSDDVIVKGKVLAYFECSCVLMYICILHNKTLISSIYTNPEQWQNQANINGGKLKAKGTLGERARLFSVCNIFILTANFTTPR